MQVGVWSPKQPNGRPATQTLQDGTTSMASSVHNRATGPGPNEETNKIKYDNTNMGTSYTERH